MPAEVKGSWAVLDNAIGSRRKLVARMIGRPLSSLEKYLLPPPSLEYPNGNGQTNPVDIFCTILDYCENPKLLLEWVANRHGFALVPKGAVQGELWADPARARELLADLERELKRRRRRPERLRSLRDELIDLLYRLAAGKEG